MTIDSNSGTDADRSNDAWLDHALKDATAEHAGAYVLDEGFTARVMASLPPAVQPVPAWRKPAVAAMWVAAAAGACIALPEVAVDVGREAFRLLATQPLSLSQIVAALALIGFGTWSAAAYALRND